MPIIDRRGFVSLSLAGLVMSTVEAALAAGQRTKLFTFVGELEQAPLARISVQARGNLRVVPVE